MSIFFTSSFSTPVFTQELQNILVIGGCQSSSQYNNWILYMVLSCGRRMLLQHTFFMLPNKPAVTMQYQMHCWSVKLPTTQCLYIIECFQILMQLRVSRFFVVVVYTFFLFTLLYLAIFFFNLLNDFFPPMLCAATSKIMDTSFLLIGLYVMPDSNRIYFELMFIPPICGLTIK